MGSISGKLFFVVVLVIAIMIILYAKQDSFTQQTYTFGDSNRAQWEISDNNSPQAPNFFPAQKPVVTAQAYFCPQDACADQLIKKIDSANSSIYVAIYSFTHDGIADALIRAKQRGVGVKVVFDYDQSKNESSDDEKLQMVGISIARRNGSGYMHNKFTIIDGNFVATGSFNYSQNADTRNDENLVFIEGIEIASKFKSDFDHLWEVSDKA